MYRLFTELRVVELASFVAGPICGLHLAQLGAEVIRIEPLEGGPDARRWPLGPEGQSLFREGIDGGKKSVRLDLKHPEGRAIAEALITAPGTGAGLFVTNLPPGGALSHEVLARKRADLITLQILGHRDGRTAVDYTINPAVGVPMMTGPEMGEPVNHVLPAWDLLCGLQAALTLFAAHEHRRRTGQGQEVRLALADVAATTLGHLGQVAEVALRGSARPRYGNALYGAFGRDFTTRDGERIMLVGLTDGQWRALVSALDLIPETAALNPRLAEDEGLRFELREKIFPLFEARLSTMRYAEAAARLDKARACWSRYQDLAEALEQEAGLFRGNSVFEEIDHDTGRWPTAGHPAQFSGLRREKPRPAPRPGTDGPEVLSRILGLSQREIISLQEHRILGVLSMREPA